MSGTVRKLLPADYRTSAWSGGTTTQLVIQPPEADYADRRFLWRVSSARVELETSDFTPLPDYDRLIATLQGTITLTHNGGEPVTLPPCRVHGFSGADRTHCEGRCTDFNLMLRRDQAAGSMEALRIPEAGLTLAADPASQQMLLFCVEGRCRAASPAEAWTLETGEALLCQAPTPLKLTGAGAVLMLCRMRELF